MQHFMWCAFRRVPTVGCCCRSMSRTSRAKRIAVLCPGQSSQYIGMMNTEEYSNNRDIKEMVDTANEILGYDIVKICQHGPAELLKRTIHCQPAVVLATLLAFKVFNDKVTASSGCDLKVDCVAGFSVGEISALYVAGRVSFEDAILLLRERASAMDYASRLTPSGMLIMQGLSFEEARQVCEDVTTVKNDPAHYVSVAIEQSRNAVSLGGSLLMLGKIMNREHKKLQDVDTVKLAMVNVSGAFHTNYMLPAQGQFHDILHKISINYTDVHLYSNVTGKRYNDNHKCKNGNSREKYSIREKDNIHEIDNIREIDNSRKTDGIVKTDNIRELLVRQLSEPVLWNSIMKYVTSDVHAGRLFRLYEVGPGKDLKAILSKTDRKLVRKVENISL